MLSILMPAYNERERVERAIADVLESAPWPEFELIVVDDGSTDGTSEILSAGCWGDRVRLLRHDGNRGKGAAVQSALAQARGGYAAILDADLEYCSSDLSRLMGPLQAGRANACFGVRTLADDVDHLGLYRLGGRGVTAACNLVFGASLGDVTSCHKVIRTDLFRALRLKSSGFAIDLEIAVRLIQRGEPIIEIPVRYQPRSPGEGKKLRAFDGVWVVGTMLRCRFT